ncbi:hypothetical protein SYNTR_1129 [Candidatus Syntrophocurvum alkaliphilum]|uniref:DUF445 domain-containing protein n=1 Tax=Candidatus Syntrophocurvum alkaliphilum TaxID=2293317 RepID=A0A6I6DFJ4_9FIRM|nr:DUF445 family protein [Candidatus Syntrophocurvum alkaliphilum]QGT99722.1 hypothetical protein SYNTR_1129 [Candidatus Syntrophocurvum alkaliphilum]
MQYQLLAIPLISAFIGYLTNVVAIKLLFWPQNPINILGLKIQGLLPTRRADIAIKIGELVESELLSLNDVIDRANTPELQEKLIEKIIDLIKLRVNANLPKFLPTRINNYILELLEKVMRQEASNIIGQVFISGKEHLNNQVKISYIITERINSLDLDDLETLTRETTSKELRFIELLGGILGFFIGVIQVLILVFFPIT